VYLLGLIWGFSFYFVKKALPGFTPWMLAFGRTALGALTLLVVLRVRRLSVPRDPSLLRHLALLAVVSNAIPFTTQSVAQLHITSTLTAVTNATTPIFTAIIGALTMSDRLRRPQIVGLALGFLGVVVAAGFGSDDLHGSAALGIVLMLSSTFSYGIGYNYARRHVVGVSPVVVAAGQQLIASVLLAPMALLSTLYTDKRPGVTSVLALAALGIVSTGLAWILNYENIARVGAANASAVTFLVPIVAFFLAVRLLHEPLLTRHVAGAAVTLFGIALLQGRIRVGRRMATT
jgi:drug/metabolite transporter (DMT)-like permease